LGFDFVNHVAAICIAGLTGGNIVLSQLFDSEYFRHGLLTFVNSARISSGEMPGIKNPPCERVDCAIWLW
jgi:hypothetical protein